MKYAAFGRTGLRVSQVVLGAGNFIDTADVYQFGPSEELLGTLRQGRREDFVQCRLAHAVAPGDGLGAPRRLPPLSSEPETKECRRPG